MFSSVQGEGPYIGCRQIFIRFEGCNLSCRYCDTGRAGENSACRVETDPGKRVFIEIANPLSVRDVIETTAGNFDLGRHHSISLTGGEPLIQADFLGELLPELKQRGIRVYLETNGSLHENLSPLIGLVDIVSMDIKLPGTSGCGPLWDRHLHFLRVANRTRVFVKIVVDDLSSISEFERAVDLIAAVDAGIPLVIQPVTRGGRCSLSPHRALQLQALGSGRLRDVRVIPQAHVMMNQL
ncbi:MAG: 7-carboxy-7-deazaguanine synthase QueE [Peptococcaceae bacterium]|nr:7-carboxy-7-deazaguanine synthase QueE [Peptococcaceae bacterium]